MECVEVHIAFRQKKLQKTSVSVKYTRYILSTTSVLSGMPKNRMTAIGPARPKPDYVTITVRFGTKSQRKDYFEKISKISIKTIIHHRNIQP